MIQNMWFANHSFPHDLSKFLEILRQDLFNFLSNKDCMYALLVQFSVYRAMIIANKIFRPRLGWLKESLFWGYMLLANYICYSTFMIVLGTKEEVIIPLPDRSFPLYWINNQAWFIHQTIRYRSQIGCLLQKPDFLVLSFICHCLLFGKLSVLRSVLDHYPLKSLK